MFGFLRRVLGNRSSPPVPEPDSNRPEVPPASPHVIKDQLVIDDQLAIVGPQAQVIVDVGTHDGTTTAQYLTTFPEARVFGFEASPANAVTTRLRLAEFGDRVKIIEKAVSSEAGRQTLHINFHDGSHSLLPLGDTRYFAGKVAEVDHVSVESTTLDDFAALEGLERIDILGMDIQGGELNALNGAKRLLAEGRIGLITLEVEFHQLYRDQPLFWDIGRFLHGYGYGFYKLHQVQPHLANPHVLCWADAIFLGPDHLKVPGPAT